MSDVMLFGILRMPFDLAMSGEISRHQYWQKGQQAANEIEKLRAEVERLRAKVERLQSIHASQGHQPSIGPGKPPLITPDQGSSGRK